MELDLTRVDLGTKTKLAMAAKGGRAKEVATWSLTPGVPFVPDFMLGNIAHVYAPPGKQARLAKTEVVADAKGVWKNTLELPPVAGEYYTVSVARKGKTELVKQIWAATERVVPMEVYYARSEAAAWTAMEAGFKSAYESTGVRFEITKYELASMAGKDFLRDTKQGQSWLHKDLKAHLGVDKLPAVKSPGSLRLFIVRTLRDYIERILSWTVRTTLPRPADIADARTGDGDKVQVVKAWVLIDGTEYGASATVSGATITVTSVDGDARALLADGATGSLKVEYRLERGKGVGGMSEGKVDNLAVIGTVFPSGNAIPANVILRLAIHEVAHVLFLTKENRPVYNGQEAAFTAKNDQWYVDKGGLGDHCMTNAHLNSDQTKVLRDTGKNTCVMFHTANEPANMDAAFCPSCSVDLRNLDLSPTGPVRSKWTL